MLLGLASLLSPILLEEFANNYYGREPLLVSGKEDRFESLCDWGSFHRLLDYLPYPNDRIRIARDGSSVVARDREQVLRAREDAATVIIEDAHLVDPKVGALSFNLASDFCQSIKANIYWSHPGCAAFNTHYDTHDVLVLQIAGKKHWRVFAEKVRSPIFLQKAHQVSAPKGPALLDRVLKEGDFLYIPRGNWHDAVAEGEPSLHITVGVYSRTGIDFLSWIVDELRASEECRLTFPIALGRDLERDAETTPSQAQYVERLKATLVAKLEENGLIQDYLAYCLSESQTIDEFARQHEFNAKSISPDTSFRRSRRQRL